MSIHGIWLWVIRRAVPLHIMYRSGTTLSLPLWKLQPEMPYLSSRAMQVSPGMHLHRKT